MRIECRPFSFHPRIPESRLTPRAARPAMERANSCGPLAKAEAAKAEEQGATRGWTQWPLAQSAAHRNEGERTSGRGRDATAAAAASWSVAKKMGTIGSGSWTKNWRCLLFLLH